MNDIYQGSFSSIGYSNFIIIIIENFNNHFSNLKIFVYAIIKKKDIIVSSFICELVNKKIISFFHGNSMHRFIYTYICFIFLVA